MKDELKYRTEQRLGYSDYDANLRRQMYWSGQWTNKQYEPNEVVKNVGQIWLCDNLTITQPGTPAGLADWTQMGGVILEVWQATPIVGMSNETILWTFVPLFPGQVARLLTYNAGTFTFPQGGAAYTFQLQPLLTFQYRANNSEASYLINASYSGVGVSTLLDIIDADSSPRTGAFTRSAFTSGVVLPADGDTILFTAVSTGTNASDVDLTIAYLQVTAPIPPV